MAPRSNCVSPGSCVPQVTDCFILSDQRQLQEVPGPQLVSLHPGAPLEPYLCSVVPTLSSGYLKTAGAGVLGEGMEMLASDTELGI